MRSMRLGYCVILLIWGTIMLWQINEFIIAATTFEQVKGVVLAISPKPSIPTVAIWIGYPHTNVTEMIVWWRRPEDCDLAVNDTVEMPICYMKYGFNPTIKYDDYCRNRELSFYWDNYTVLFILAALWVSVVVSGLFKSETAN